MRRERRFRVRTADGKLTGRLTEPDALDLAVGLRTEGRPAEVVDARDGR